MDNRLSKIKTNIKAKKQTLRSIGAGFILFIIFFVLTKIIGGSICPIKNIFNVSCFGCGMTRAFISILQLDLVSAFYYNVLSIPLFFGIVIYTLFLIIDIVFSKNLLYSFENFLSKKFMFLVYILLLLGGAYLNNIL